MFLFYWKGIKNGRKNIREIITRKIFCKTNDRLFIIGFKETENKDKFEEIINNVTTVVVNIDKNKLVDLVNTEVIEKVDLYWNLTVEQMLSYAYIVFTNLMKFNRNIELKDITSEFLVVAKLYSPDNAVEYVRNKTTNMAGGKCE